MPKNPRPRFRRHRPLFANTELKKTEKPKIRWRILPIVWLAVKRTAMMIGFLVIISTIISWFVIGSALKQVHKATGPVALPDEIVLTLEFKDNLADLTGPADLAETFAPPKPTVRELVESITAAKDDPRVKGIFARMEDGTFELAHVQEVRKALAEFKESGKFAYIYSSSFGSHAGGMSRYYLASAFDQLWMQPLGIVSIPGVNATMPFLRDMMKELGITPQFFQRHEYKTAYESLTNQQMSPASREMLQEIVNEFKTELVSDIAADRNLTEEQVLQLVDQGLHTSEEALETGLIDEVNYADVLLDQILVATTGKTFDELPRNELPLVPAQAYHAELERWRADNFLAYRRPKVALVHIDGAILKTDGRGGPGFGSGIAASDVIAPAILRAADDPQVKALVLRVNSPGGSPVAAESILRAVAIARAKGKPVIVSMGPTAASGGYWVAAYADRIFTLPTTLTGSIGVLGGKIATGDLMDKIHVNWDRVTWGKNATIWSLVQPFSESEALQVNQMLDYVYASFLARVAEGRNMSPEQVDDIARGRVWTGSRAVEIGLADEFGGLAEALDHAAELAGADDRTDVKVELFPKPKTTLERLAELLSGQIKAGQVLQTQAHILEMLKPLTGAAALSVKPENYGTYEPVRVK